VRFLQVFATVASLRDVTGDRLPDSWTARDRPVLLAAAKLDGDNPLGLLASDLIAVELEMDATDVTKSLIALDDAGYVTATAHEVDLAGLVSVNVVRLRERGRREVGMWPDGDTAAAALIDALRQAEELTDDPDDKSALRKAAGQLASVSRSVIADLTTAYIRSQTGI